MRRVSYSTKPQILSYIDAIGVFNDETVIDDLNASCQKLAQSMVALMQTFEAISTQLHTLDLQGLTPEPWKPRWNYIRKNFVELVWESRTNAGIISGRLKMFCNVVLPLTVRGLNGKSSRSHSEKMQVLQSYMSISSDHSALTRTLTENAMSLTASLNNFHTDFAKFVSHRATSGQRELCDLAHKFGDLEDTVKQLYFSQLKLVGPDVTYLAFSALRLIGSSGRRPSQSKFTTQRLALTGSEELATVGTVHIQLDRTRSEIAHALYAAQVSHRKTDVLTTARSAMSSLVCDEIIAVELGLGLYLSIWSRLQADCVDVYKWLRDTRNRPELPLCVASYLNSGETLYSNVAKCLDTYVAGIDPRLFPSQ